MQRHHGSDTEPAGPNTQQPPTQVAGAVGPVYAVTFRKWASPESVDKLT